MATIDFGQVFTKPYLADFMVNLFTLPPGSTVLDPCFGTGVFIESLSNNKKYHLSGFELDQNLFSEYQKNHQNYDLVNSDFLLYPHNKQYDGIIMNPPYVRHEKIDELKNYGVSKERLLHEKIYSDLPKVANLYMYFILKSISLLKPNGELIVIFPSSWVKTSSGSKFKKLIKQECNIAQSFHVRGVAFESKALVEVIILKLVKNTSIQEAKPKFLFISDMQLQNETTKNLLIPTWLSIPFTKLATIHRGITTGYNNFFINPTDLPNNDENYLQEIISTPKAITGYTTKEANYDQILILPETGLNDKIKKYLLKWEGKIISDNSPKTLCKKIESGRNWYSINPVKSNGILFNYFVRDDIRFIFNETGVLARDNFYVISPKINPFLMFALLNNYYTYLQLELVGKKYGIGLLKIQTYDFLTLKFIDLELLSPEDKKRLVRLASHLIHTGNKSYIDEITKVLSKYGYDDLNTIKKLYSDIKKKRLEAENDI